MNFLNDDRVLIDTKSLESMHRMFVNTAAIRSAFEAIRHGLFNGGLKLSHPKYETTDELADDLRRYWLPWLSDVLRDLVKYGFVVCAFDKDMHPYVLEPGQLTIVMYTDGVAKYSVMKRRAGKLEELKDVYVYQRDRPSLDGTPTSLLMSLYQTLATAHHYTQCAVVSEAQRSNPVHYVESVSKRGEDHGISDVVALEDALNSAHERKVRENDAILHTVNRANANLEEVARSVCNDPKSMVDGQAICKGNYGQYIPVPTGHRLVQTSSAESPRDLINLFKMRDEHISRVLGVPGAMFSQSSSRGGATVSFQLFTETLRNWRATLSEVMLLVYYGYSKLDNVTVHFGNTLPVERIDDFYKRGMLPYSEWKRMMSAHYNIDESVFNSTPETESNLSVEKDTPVEDEESHLCSDL